MEGDKEQKEMMQGGDATEVVANASEEAQQVDNGATDVIVRVVTPLGDTIFVGHTNPIETTTFVKQNLAEFVETCGYTCYRLEHRGDETTSFSDFLEIANYLPALTLPENTLTLHLVPEEYDVKKARAHVKRIREVLSYPPQNRGVLQMRTPDEDTKPERAPKLPTEDSLFTEMSLKNFYDEALYRVGTPAADTSLPIDTIKSLVYCGWNTPPATRRMQGDLFYLEVSYADENNARMVKYITATPKGFYLNRSSREHFDPTPATPPYFSHSLLATLRAFLPNLNRSWNSHLEHLAVAPSHDARPLDQIATFFAQGKGDAISTTAQQWNVLMGSKSMHKYDASRALDEYALDSLLGEDKGALREWNEEIQSVRHLQPKDVSESIVKARFMHRVYAEFREACRQVILAIADGQVAPLNPHDTEDAQVYIFNNIFVSRVVESKDSYKAFEGEDAARKAAKQDFHNQKLIQSVHVSGLNTVMTAMVDFRGVRFVAQSIVPGILPSAQSKHSARLMLGSLEDGTRIKSKKEALEMMKSVASKLLLAERQVPAIVAPKQDAPELAPIATSFLSAADNSGQVITVDNDDEVDPVDSETVTHIGPIEGKILCGTDGRMYMMEVSRLTPLDANYIRGDKGTGLIEAKVLEQSDAKLSRTYILRSELVTHYVQQKVLTLRQEKMMEVIEKQKQIDAEKEKAATSEETADATKEVSTEAKPETSDDAKAESNANLTQEVYSAIRDINAESVKVELNPNCFLECMKQDDVLAADEEVARSLARFLFDSVLPYATEQVRVGEVYPLDNAALVTYLHGVGINMRYLGRLASLAAAQEAEDLKLLAEGQQRRHAMPKFWLEMLETEVVARSVKHILSDLLRSKKELRTAPAAVIAEVLNHLLGGSLASIDESVNLIAPEKEGKKNKKKKNGHVKSEASIADVSSVVPSFSASVMAKDKFLALLKKTATSRFSAILTTIDTPRWNTGMVLRRVCQLTGVRVVSKEYNFTLKTPFAAADVFDMQPVIVVSEPDVPLAEARVILESARAEAQQGNLAGAFDLAQNASRWIQQVTGVVHKEVALAMDTIITILLAAGNYGAAVETINKSLAACVQLYGLDSVETVQHHLQLHTAHLELGQHARAIEHLLAAKYIVELIGGARHPELSNLYVRMGTVFSEAEKYTTALRCMHESNNRLTQIGDMSKVAMVFQHIAELAAKLNNYREAIQVQKQCYVLFRQILGDSDQHTVEAKNRCELYIRSSSEHVATQQKDKQEKEKDEHDKEMSMWLDDSLGKTSKKSSKKKGKKK